MTDKKDFSSQLNDIKDKFDKKEIANGVQMLHAILQDVDPSSELKQCIQLVIDNRWHEQLGERLLSDDVELKERVLISAVFADITAGSDDQDLRLVGDCNILPTINKALIKYKYKKNKDHPREYMHILDDLLFSLINLVSSDDPNTPMSPVVIKEISFATLLDLWDPSDANSMINRRLLELMFNLVHAGHLPLTETQVLVPHMSNVLSTSTDEGLLYNALRLLSNLSGTVRRPVLETKDIVERVHVLIEANVLVSLNKLLAHPSQTVSAKAMHVLANLVGGTDSDTRVVLQSGVLDTIVGALLPADEKRNNDFIREACWLMSNCIVSDAGDQAHSILVIDALIQRDILKFLLAIAPRLSQTTQLDIAILIKNWLDNGAPRQVQYLLGAGMSTILVLCEFVKSTLGELQQHALQCLLMLHKYDIQTNKSVQVLESIKNHLSTERLQAWSLVDDELEVGLLASQILDQLELCEKLMR